ncbi:N-acetylmuramoyl-L-alanine amidase [candidate division CSSED10-310 bacterium]|uniref:N-acetylmuramoyl-L-alanine amidase n=1 Tax=candidate division CSSED10-310 bacterium TaxID=2855610 RepID=A0ABV6YVM0_UNCC1
MQTLVRYVFLIFVLFQCCFFTAVAFSNVDQVPLDKNNIAEITQGRYIFLRLEAKEIVSNVVSGDKIEEYYNSAGKYYRIPYEKLNSTTKRRVFTALFPEDYLKNKFWYHHVTYSGQVKGGENLFRIALWLTGTGFNYKKIQKVNENRRSTIQIGDWVKVPRELLLPCFISVTSDNADSSSESTNKNNELGYDRDREGDYALYRLKKGEALYSAVVMRFTGRVTAAEVNELAIKIARRSGISDVTSIPVGYGIKIPLLYLIPEYLPPADPRHIAYLQNRQQSKQYIRQILAKNLEGIKIVIDAGHGGRDPGSIGYNKVMEDEYVYDIACRIRKLLLENTQATVAFTNFDRIHKYLPRNTSFLPNDKNEILLTTPVYKNTDSVTSVHLRWYLSNSLYREWLRKQGTDETIIFLSVHADALHPSAEGTTIYIPASELGTSRYGKKGAFFSRFKEVREQQFVSYSMQQRFRAEAYSKKLAQNILLALSQDQLKIHKRKPIREYIVRKNKAWIPAVLKYNQIPGKVLLEVANLKNTADCKRIRDYTYRERYARAVVKGLILYFK